MTQARNQILALLRAQFEAIRAHEAGTRSGSDPEQLHGMRTAVRRFRAILGAARAMFAPGWLESLRSELDWLGKVLGDVRDLDVLREHFRSELAALRSARAATSQTLLHGIDVRRARAQGRMRAALDSPRYARLLRRLESAVRHPRVVAADLSLPDVAAGQFKKLRKAVRSLPDNPSSRALHAVRIKVKRARYAAELAEAAVGRPAKRFVKRAKEVQDILGVHQDAVVAEKRLRALLGDARRPPARMLAKRLLERERGRRQAAQTDFLEQWPKLKRQGRKTWT